LNFALMLTCPPKSRNGGTKADALARYCEANVQRLTSNVQLKEGERFDSLTPICFPSISQRPNALFPTRSE
jgi:hypothetical protein